MINELNRHELNVMTIEDPIEYNFSDITQMQVSEKSGINFSTCLKAALRHDPDVILVGEIRDPDTAKIAVQAALTGHLVMASIHANDVASMIFRMVHLGIEPYLISSTLIGLLAQRLVRCVCQYCSEPSKPKMEEGKMYQDQEQANDRRRFLGYTARGYKQRNDHDEPGRDDKSETGSIFNKGRSARRAPDIAHPLNNTTFLY
jgi:type II secretory ATPase GspE/PulE/Tfp pilus assembly ATPase PilB-like protein